MSELPTGTVTFLFSDIEGSTARWEHHPEAMRAALQRHVTILEAAIHGQREVVVSRMGDGMAAVFAIPDGASGFIVQLRRQTTDLLTSALGERRLRGLRAVGDAMDNDQSVVYALDVIAKARATI